MASYNPVIKNGAGGAIFYLGLPSATISGAMQPAPTLAAGDVKVSLDGGALNNLTTLPVVTPAAGKLVKVTLSQAETNADNIAIVFADQTSPAEWCDTVVTIQTVAANFDSLSARVPAALVGGKMDSNVGTFTAGAITAAAFTAGAIDANAIATDAIGAAELAASAVTEIQTGLATAAAIAAVQADTDDIQVRVAAVQADTDDIQARLPAALVGGKIDANVGTVTPGTIPTAVQNATELLDQAAGVEAGLTVRQALRLVAAVLFGRASGMATTTAVFRDTPNTKARVTATVDTDGNRSAVTLDPS
jgi:hypothetical protein